MGNPVKYIEIFILVLSLNRLLEINGVNNSTKIALSSVNGGVINYPSHTENKTWISKLLDSFMNTSIYKAKNEEGSVDEENQIQIAFKNIRNDLIESVSESLIFEEKGTNLYNFDFKKVRSLFGDNKRLYELMLDTLERESRSSIQQCKVTTKKEFVMLIERYIENYVITGKSVAHITTQKTTVAPCYWQNTRNRGTDIPGSIITRTKTLDSMGCQVKCQENENCNFFLYFTRNHPQWYKRRECRLLREGGELERNLKGHISGPKFCGSLNAKKSDDLVSLKNSLQSSEFINSTYVDLIDKNNNLVKILCPTRHRIRKVNVNGTRKEVDIPGSIEDIEIAEQFCNLDAKSTTFKDSKSLPSYLDGYVDDLLKANFLNASKMGDDQESFQDFIQERLLYDVNIMAEKSKLKVMLEIQRKKYCDDYFDTKKSPDTIEVTSSSSSLLRSKNSSYIPTLIQNSKVTRTGGMFITPKSVFDIKSVSTRPNEVFPAKVPMGFDIEGTPKPSENQVATTSITTTSFNNYTKSDAKLSHVDDQDQYKVGDLLSDSSTDPKITIAKVSFNPDVISNLKTEDNGSLNWSSTTKENIKNGNNNTNLFVEKKLKIKNHIDSKEEIETISQDDDSTTANYISDKRTTVFDDKDRKVVQSVPGKMIENENKVNLNEVTLERNQTRKRGSVGNELNIVALTENDSNLGLIEQPERENEIKPKIEAASDLKTNIDMNTSVMAEMDDNFLSIPDSESTEIADIQTDTENEYDVGLAAQEEYEIPKTDQPNSNLNREITTLPDHIEWSTFQVIARTVAKVTPGSSIEDDQFSTALTDKLPPETTQESVYQLHDNFGNKTRTKNVSEFNPDFQKFTANQLDIGSRMISENDSLQMLDSDISNEDDLLSEVETKPENDSKVRSEVKINDIFDSDKDVKTQRKDVPTSEQVTEIKYDTPPSSIKPPNTSQQTINEMVSKVSVVTEKVLEIDKFDDKAVNLFPLTSQNIRWSDIIEDDYGSSNELYMDTIIEDNYGSSNEPSMDNGTSSYHLKNKNINNTNNNGDTEKSTEAAVRRQNDRRLKDEETQLGINSILPTSKEYSNHSNRLEEQNETEENGLFVNLLNSLKRITTTEDANDSYSTSDKTDLMGFVTPVIILGVQESTRQTKLQSNGSSLDDDKEVDKLDPQVNRTKDDKTPKIIVDGVMISDAKASMAENEPPGFTGALNDNTRNHDGRILGSHTTISIDIETDGLANTKLSRPSIKTSDSNYTFQNEHATPNSELYTINTSSTKFTLNPNMTQKKTAGEHAFITKESSDTSFKPQDHPDLEDMDNISISPVRIINTTQTNTNTNISIQTGTNLISSFPNTSISFEPEVVWETTTNQNEENNTNATSLKDANLIDITNKEIYTNKTDSNTTIKIQNGADFVRKINESTVQVNDLSDEKISLDLSKNTNNSLSSTDYSKATFSFSTEKYLQESFAREDSKLSIAQGKTRIDDDSVLSIQTNMSLPIITRHFFRSQFYKRYPHTKPENVFLSNDSTKLTNSNYSNETTSIAKKGVLSKKSDVGRTSPKSIHVPEMAHRKTDDDINNQSVVVLHLQNTKYNHTDISDKKSHMLNPDDNNDSSTLEREKDNQKANIKALLYTSNVFNSSANLTNRIPGPLITPTEDSDFVSFKPYYFDIFRVDSTSKKGKAGGLPNKKLRSAISKTKNQFINYKSKYHPSSRNNNLKLDSENDNHSEEKNKPLIESKHQDNLSRRNFFNERPNKTTKAISRQTIKNETNYSTSDSFTQKFVYFSPDLHSGNKGVVDDFLMQRNVPASQNASLARHIEEKIAVALLYVLSSSFVLYVFCYYTINAFLYGYIKVLFYKKV